MREPICPACDGPGFLLGGLGNLTHYRCRDCGVDFSRKARPRKPKTDAQKAAAYLRAKGR
jgi:tRNA(Ile2) C34 agmatinyltransferase TiaS